MPTSEIDAALAEVRRRAAGRTRYEGQPRPVDELLAEEVERLRVSERAAWNAAVVRDEEVERLRARVRLRDDLLDWCELRLSLAWVDYVHRQRRALENDRG